jgi:hypothetical protein
MSRPFGRLECLKLLAAAVGGRIAFSANCLPAASPVRLELAGERLLVALSPEIEDQTIKMGDVVGLEIDDSTPLAPASWAVSTTGVVLNVFDDPAVEPPASSLSWAPSAGLPLLSLSIEQISGQAFDFGIYQETSG